MGQGSFDADRSFLAMLDERQEACDEERLEALEKGFHTTRDGRRIELSKMDNDHLKNSINYASKNIESPYWSIATLCFQDELKNRNIPKKVLLGELV